MIIAFKQLLITIEDKFNPLTRLTSNSSIFTPFSPFKPRDRNDMETWKSIKTNSGFLRVFRFFLTENVHVVNGGKHAIGKKPKKDPFERVSASLGTYVLNVFAYYISFMDVAG